MRLLPHFFALLACLLFTTAAAAGPDTVTLRVLSFNIRSSNISEPDPRNDWPNRRAMVMDVLRNQDADVVGLQEATRTQLNEIHAAVPGYGEYAVGAQGGSSGSHCAILYRTSRFDRLDAGIFWLSPTPEVSSPGWFDPTRRTCAWVLLRERSTGRIFYHFNTHLDNDSQPDRQYAADLIASRLAARAINARFVLTGDFNAAERTPEMDYFMGRRPLVGPNLHPSPRLKNAYRVIEPTTPNSGTFNSWVGNTSGNMIDYILVEGATLVTAAEIDRYSVDGRYPSDHYPVAAVVHLGPPTSPDLDGDGVVTLEDLHAFDRTPVDIDADGDTDDADRGLILTPIRGGEVADLAAGR